MPSSLVEAVARYLSINSETVRDVCAGAPFSYRIYRIPKSSGGWRAIYMPAAKTKALQHALVTTCLREFNVHPAAHAYVRGAKSPLRTNALRHADYLYSVRVDFVDFFPSIGPEALFRRLREQRPMLDEEEGFLRDALFVRGPNGIWGLPIGAPSSPLVSNLVMFPLDQSLTGWAASRGGVYTRYADDMVFSSSAKGECGLFLAQLKQLLLGQEWRRLRINDRKTVFSSRSTRRRITGLIISSEGEVSLGRRKKRYVRRLLSKLSHGSISGERRAYLCGYLAFILDVEPEFLNRLAVKFTASLLQAAMHPPPHS